MNRLLFVALLVCGAVSVAATVLDDAQGVWVGTCTTRDSNRVSDGEHVCSPTPGVTHYYNMTYDGDSFIWFVRPGTETLSDDVAYYLNAGWGEGTVYTDGTTFSTSLDAGGCYFVNVIDGVMYESGTGVLESTNYSSECPTEWVSPDDNTCSFEVGTATYSCELTKLDSGSAGRLVPPLILAIVTLVASMLSLTA